MEGSINSEEKENNKNFNNESNNTDEIEFSQLDEIKLAIVSKKYFIIDNKFACFKNFCIGSGSFGKVLYGMLVDRKQEFGIKFEKSNIKNSVIAEELKIYSDLKGGDGIPNIFWKGEYKNYKVFIMDLLGPSLDKFYKINNKLNLQTTIFFGEQMVNRLEYLHSKNYIHRDVKPNNFLLGKYNRKFDDDKVYIIDFGLSKEYIDKKTKRHYDFNDNSKFVGTPRYASINTHMGIRQSRRDDLESVAYILIYFLNGELPWQGIRAKTKSEKKEKIKVSKVSFDVESQCLNKNNIPKELISFLEYTKSLDFSEKPDYNYISSLFERIKKNNDPEKFDKSKLMWEWDLDFLSVKKDEKKINIASYSHYENIYRKLYEGYPIPEYDDFLEILEKNEISRNKINKNSNINKKIGTGVSSNSPLRKKNNINGNFELEKDNNGNNNNILNRNILINNISIEENKLNNYNNNNKKDNNIYNNINLKNFKGKNLKKNKNDSTNENENIKFDK
jgi:serine/threonine protein kinase